MILETYEDFIGTKTALFYDTKLVTFLRDNTPGLRFANMWDFPGGGREGNETPMQCLQREVKEELGIALTEDQILWQKEYPAMHNPRLRAYFFVTRINKEQHDSIRFGTEGQRWELVSVSEFMSRDDAVPHLKTRLQDYLDSRDSSKF